MTAPDTNFEPVEAASWAADTRGADNWTAGAAEPFDDVPAFDELNDPEVDVNARLAADKAMIRRPTRRLFADYRPNPEAWKHLETLPADGESLHGIISGRYALWEMVPALIARTGQNIDELTIATLSYSRSNAAELLDLIDEGRIGRVSLLISYFFKAQNRPLYDSLVPPLRARGHRVLAMRTHCKIILARMADGRQYVAESSADLRSSKNVEQFVLSRDDKLYAFHYAWLDGELLRPRTREESDD